MPAENGERARVSEICVYREPDAPKELRRAEEFAPPVCELAPPTAPRRRRPARQRLRVCAVLLTAALSLTVGGVSARPVPVGAPDPAPVSAEPGAPAAPSPTQGPQPLLTVAAERFESEGLHLTASWDANGALLSSLRLSVREDGTGQAVYTQELTREQAAAGSYDENLTMGFPPGRYLAVLSAEHGGGEQPVVSEAQAPFELEPIDPYCLWVGLDGGTLNIQYMMGEMGVETLLLNAPEQVREGVASLSVVLDGETALTGDELLAMGPDESGWFFNVRLEAPDFEYADITLTYYAPYFLQEIRTQEKHYEAHEEFRASKIYVQASASYVAGTGDAVLDFRCDAAVRSCVSGSFTYSESSGDESVSRPLTQSELDSRQVVTAGLSPGAYLMMVELELLLESGETLTYGSGAYVNIP